MGDAVSSRAPARAHGLFSPLTYHGYRFTLCGRVLAPTGGVLLAQRPIREIASG
jgi:hypothetical protein